MTTGIQNKTLLWCRERNIQSLKWAAQNSKMHFVCVSYRHLNERGNGATDRVQRPRDLRDPSDSAAAADAAATAADAVKVTGAAAAAVVF